MNRLVQILIAVDDFTQQPIDRIPDAVREWGVVRRMSQELPPTNIRRNCSGRRSSWGGRMRDGFRDSPLWTIGGNVLISGHSAGLSQGYSERFCALVIRNLCRFHEGEPLETACSKENTA